MPSRLPVVQRALLHDTFQTSEQLPDSVSAPSTKHQQQGRRTEVLRQATNRDGIQLCVKTLQITMTRAWTLEMTEDWTHSRIMEHDKACVILSTVEHNVALEHFDSSLAHSKTLASEGRCKEEIVLASLEDDVARKNAMERPFYGRDSCNEKIKRKKSPKKQKLRGSSPQTLQLRSSLAGPRMALHPGRRTSQSALPPPDCKILPFRKCTQQPFQLTITAAKG